jgi:hypothetical protein
MPNAAFRTKEYDRANQDGNRSGQRVNQASEVVDHVFLPNVKDEPRARPARLLRQQEA